MSDYNSAKYQAVRAIIEQQLKVESPISLRQRCIPIIEGQLGMSTAGASTYFSNMNKHMGGDVRPVAHVNVSLDTTKEPV